MVSDKSDSHQSFAGVACLSCKTRKKKCNKALPSCGYCARKRLACRYPSPGVDGGNRHIHLERLSPIVGSSLLLMDTLSPVNLSSHVPLDSLLETASVDEFVHAQVHRIIHTTGRFLGDIIQEFFLGIHRYAPIVGRKRIYNVLAGLPVVSPPADFSILLLSICLHTHRPRLNENPASFGIHQESLYLSAKSLSSQVQAITVSLGQPSLFLIQAKVLIAIFEYGRGMPDTAFLSIAECARLGYAAGLHRRASNIGTEPQWKEEANTWWAINIYERLIFCDVGTSRDQPFSAAMPSPHTLLPTEPKDLDSTETPTATPVSVSCLTADDVGSLGRGAQAAWILDQVFQAMREPKGQARLFRLGQVDRTLQEFMMRLMKQVRESDELLCGAIAVVIRTFFLLHEFILEEKPAVGEETSSWQAHLDQSRAALETATKMMIDIIDDGSRISLPSTWPPSRIYRLRAALTHINSRPELRKDAWFRDAEGRLRDALDVCSWYRGATKPSPVRYQ
ncbi:uncharacterized protein N7459_004761 [Penicillium hispanicum]|uniref:uncharacterized protein n=1 Tax=Penicillium hispanicum TaxID=1080232 RepID=UPI002540FCBB|nr:uncharacterized protein N7459_004761 [Penicillium hispanicum]KAJ5584961.1 hypothetical protein N7459_004761 [Penicillium hispanicum]